jgi:hypothetical protein
MTTKIMGNKVDEGVPVREVSNIESATKDTIEAEDE